LANTKDRIGLQEKKVKRKKERKERGNSKEDYVSGFFRVHKKKVSPLSGV
jgi:hypothetical protein